jgi:hypothetical protein
VRINRAGIDFRIAHPDAGQQLFARQNATDIAQKDDREIKFTLGQIDIAPASESAPFRSTSILPKRSELGLRAVPAPQQGLNARHELHIADWLGNIVIGAQPQDIGGVFFRRARRAKNNRHIPATIFPDVFEDFIATDIGQRPVNDEEIESCGISGLHAGSTPSAKTST